MHQRRTITALASKAFMVCALLALACGPGLAQEAKTSKERLSGKGFDEQRVDNCRVPMQLRGAIPRPDCSVEGSASASDESKTQPQTNTRGDGGSARRGE